MESIQIRGARTHNLRSVDVDIPRGQLTVITGVSGSGKSSLAIDTLFAEGQRQYIESLSPQTRQYLQQLPRPDVDAISGLPPTICVDQQRRSANPRSTVGTITEIYDYLRILYVRCGQVRCYRCDSEIVQQSPLQILESITKLPFETKLIVMAPVIRGQKGQHRDVFNTLRRSGIVKTRIDGTMYDLDALPNLDAQRDHSIEAIIDRIVLRPQGTDRLSEAIHLAVRLSEGLVTISYRTQDDESASLPWTEKLFSTKHACASCGINYEELEPRTLSFNSPYGACPTCKGMGILKDEKVQGDDEDESVANDEQTQILCPDCGGTRLRPEARGVRIGGWNIAELSQRTLTECRQHLEGNAWPEPTQRVADALMPPILNRIHFLEQVGVDYLSLARTADTLSGGELQRVRLATCIGSGLTGACYVLDEPSIGLHPRDNARLIGSLRNLQQQGNTVVVVEHDDDILRQSDWIIEMGPQAGVRGGQLIETGSVATVLQQGKSLTARVLLNNELIPWPTSVRPQDCEKQIIIRGAEARNLKRIDAEIPLGLFVGVSGVSGSGKSTLIVESLIPAIRDHLMQRSHVPPTWSAIEGVDQIDRLILIDQKPIGRSPKSNPATYTKVFDELRKLFATTRDAKQRGFQSKRFSFNAGSGRCETCLGQGSVRVDMGFLADVYVPCERCQGSRFNRQTLQVRYRGKNIADCLDMEIQEAKQFFENIDKIYRVLAALDQVGLGYLKLGQSAPTLSGGECQRLKLATELATRDSGKTLYVLDEPTTGLHLSDVKRLIEVLQSLVDRGNTVLVIEHHLDLLKCCDWLIDMGPEGGAAGGHILFAGSPRQLAEVPDNATGQWLKKRLEPIHEKA